MTSATNLIELIVQSFDDLGIEYAIGGSFASSAWGNPRQTNDLDIAIRVKSVTAKDLVVQFQDHFLVSESEIEAAFTDTGPFRSFQLLHIEEIFKVDVFVHAEEQYTQRLFERRKQFSIGPYRMGWFYSPEDIVLVKLRWFELGRRVSDRQWNDIVQVIENQGESFDRGYALKWAVHFGVEDDLEQIFLQTDPNTSR